MIAEAKQVEIRLSARQTRAWDVFNNPTVRSLLYGGAKGGGKSVFFCLAFYGYAAAVIADFGLSAAAEPVPIGWMGRKRAVDFKKTTLESWKRTIPAGCYTLRKADQEIIIQDRVKFFYGGLDDEKSIQKFNSAEFGIVGLDQAEEAGKDEVAVLRATLRLKIGGRELPYKELFTANPGQGWLKVDYVTAAAMGTVKGGRCFVQALPSDNPFLAAEYVATLREAFGHRPELLEAYLHGSWDAFADADQCIREAWLRAAWDRTRFIAQPRRFLMCEPARFGDCETVIYQFRETDIEKEKIFGQKDLMYTANILHTTAIQEEIPAVGVETTGVGGGIFDRLAEMSGGKYMVIPVQPEAKAGRPEVYGNRRAEMWDHAARLGQEGELVLSRWDLRMITQVCAPRYEFRNGKMYIEKKEKIIERLGCSPDRGECYVEGLWILDQVPRTAGAAARRRSVLGPRERERGVSAMAS